MATELNRTAGNTYSLQSIVPELPAALQDNTDPTSNPTNDFLKLMVAQLQNQDPEKPIDGTALISQLTQMQSAFAVQRMSFLSQASQQVTTSAALLGRTVAIRDPKTGAELSGKVMSIDYSGKDPSILVNQQMYPLTAVSRVDV
jgi:flagellar basal-body rod modification protein FlgD